MSCKETLNCRLCGGELVEVWDLKETPLANNYLKNPTNTPETFPLVLKKCIDCDEHQLGHDVEASKMFCNYLYLTDYSPSLVKHFKKYAESVVKSFGRPIKVLEIGSNSGVLLQFFKDLGCSVLGFEPAQNLAKLANDKGLETVNGFFNEQTAKILANTHGRFDVVCANNVFAHVPDIRGIIKASLSLLADEESMLIFENAYWPDSITKGYIDQVYHEHSVFHSVKPINKLINSLGATLVDVNFNEIQGGSCRFFVRNGITYQRTEVRYAITEEELSGINSPSIYQQWKLELSKRAAYLDFLVSEAKNQNKTVGIFSYPAKSTTLFNSIVPILDKIDFIVDDSDFKQGLYIPNGNLKINSPQILGNYDPKKLVLIVGAYNCYDDIVSKNKQLIEQGVQFIKAL